MMRMPPSSRTRSAKALTDAIADDAPRAHLGAPDNIAARFPVKVGDADRAFAGAAHVFREKIHQHRGGAARDPGPDDGTDPEQHQVE